MHISLTALLFTTSTLSTSLPLPYYLLHQCYAHLSHCPIIYYINVKLISPTALLFTTSMLSHHSHCPILYYNSAKHTILTEQYSVIYYVNAQHITLTVLLFTTSMLSKPHSLTIVLLCTTNKLLSDHTVPNVCSQTQGCLRMFPELKLSAYFNLHCPT